MSLCGASTYGACTGRLQSLIRESPRGREGRPKVVKNTTASRKKTSSRMEIKVDWLTVTVPPVNDSEIVNGAVKRRFKLLEYMGFKLTDMKPTEYGRFAYNSGLTYQNMVFVYYDDPQKKINKFSAGRPCYMISGQGTTLLLQKLKQKYHLNWEEAWFRFFRHINKIQGRVTRIDLCVDCFHHEFPDMERVERKLRRGEYKSSKRSFNVIRQTDREGNTKSYTIYIGQSRTHKISSVTGSTFCRIYDKLCETNHKHALLPKEVKDLVTGAGSGSWIRVEQQYNKRRAQVCVDEILKAKSFGKVYMGTMKDTLELLQPSRKNKDKKTWKLDPQYKKWLQATEKIKLSNPERDVMLGDLLHWIRVAVVPSLRLVSEIGEARGFNFWQMLKDCEIDDYQKKQKRLYDNAVQMPDKLLKFYLSEFMRGYGKHD